MSYLPPLSVTSLSPALPHCRFDILAAICLYCPDLTEKAAVEILLACANAREEELVSQIASNRDNILMFYVSDIQPTPLLRDYQ